MGITEAVQYVPVSENGVLSGYYQVVGMTEINLDHEYYKEHPYIDFTINGKEYKVSTEDMKRLAMNSTKDVKERFCVVDSDNIEDKEKDVSGESFFDNTFDGTAEMVSIPDRPMMAAVIMSGMLACGGMEHNDSTLVNRAVRLADMILEETEDKTKEE